VSCVESVFLEPRVRYRDPGLRCETPSGYLPYAESSGSTKFGTTEISNVRNWPIFGWLKSTNLRLSVFIRGFYSFCRMDSLNSALEFRLLYLRKVLAVGGSRGSRGPINRGCRPRLALLEPTMTQPLTVSPGTSVALTQFDPRYVEGDWTKKSARKQIRANTTLSAELAYRLYAENRRALLLVLQGMDTAGKDGTIRTVMTGINPQSCQVVPFKQPSHEEIDHDFLWRIHRAVPRRGNIGIFNRSQYEDVLVVRVHNLVPETEWSARYDRINEFEQMLVEGGVTILKCFLHISKEAQRERLQARLDNPEKRWKFSKGDLAERKRWDDYQRAYEAALTKCNTEHAPWHIIPSDRKWARNLAVSQLLLDTLERLDPQVPPCEEGLEAIVVE